MSVNAGAEGLGSLGSPFGRTVSDKGGDHLADAGHHADPGADGGGAENGPHRSLELTPAKSFAGLGEIDMFGNKPSRAGLHCFEHFGKGEDANDKGDEGDARAQRVEAEGHPGRSGHRIRADEAQPQTQAGRDGPLEARLSGNTSNENEREDNDGEHLRRADLQNDQGDGANHGQGGEVRDRVGNGR